MNNRRSARWILLIALSAVSACDTGTETNPPPEQGGEEPASLALIADSVLPAQKHADLAARVTDASGRPVQGVEVAFDVRYLSAGEGEAAGRSSFTATSDADGVAHGDGVLLFNGAAKLTARIPNRAALRDSMNVRFRQTLRINAWRGSTTIPGGSTYLDSLTLNGRACAAEGETVFATLSADYPTLPAIQTSFDPFRRDQTVSWYPETTSVLVRPESQYRADDLGGKLMRLIGRDEDRIIVVAQHQSTLADTIEVNSAPGVPYFEIETYREPVGDDFRPVVGDSFPLWLQLDCQVPVSSETQVEWKSSNENVVRIVSDSIGPDYFAGPLRSTAVLEALSPGAATITATPSSSDPVVFRLNVVAADAESISPEPIAFTSGRDGNFEIYLINPDGTGITNLSNNPSTDSDPAWSPDRSRIAFISNRAGNRDIYVMNADGTGVEQLTSTPQDEYFPQWSPDGTRLVYSVDAGSEVKREDIWTIRADGADAKRVFETGFNSWYHRPSWSPDGNHLVLTNQGGSSGVSLVKYTFSNMLLDVLLQGSVGASRYTNYVGGKWSPDGESIVVQGYRDTYEGSGIMTLRPDGTGLFRYDLPAEAYHPSWSPDGRHIVFAMDTDDGLDLFRINVEGGGLTRLTTASGTDGAPAWD